MNHRSSGTGAARLLGFATLLIAPAAFAGGSGEAPRDPALQRIDGRWMVSGMTFRALYRRGNDQVPSYVPEA